MDFIMMYIFEELCKARNDVVLYLLLYRVIYLLCTCDLMYFCFILCSLTAIEWTRSTNPRLFLTAPIQSLHRNLWGEVEETFKSLFVGVQYIDMLNHKVPFARVSITLDTDCTLNVNTSPTEVLSFHKNALLDHAGKGELNLSANPPCKVGNVLSLNGAYVALIPVAVSSLVVGKFKIFTILHCIRVIVVLNCQ